tara:strand:- start:1215 stop:1868 length:654 start_codon:yes stop_codon:yes gene_type:complete
MSDQPSPQALARKKLFLEEKKKAGGFDELVKITENRELRLYFDERGDIMSLTREGPEQLNPLWITAEFDQHHLNQLEEKDINQFWVVTDSAGKCKIALRPQATVYASMPDDATAKIPFGEGDADLFVSISESKATIWLSPATIESFKGTYPIQATVKGKRIFKFFLADPNEKGVIFDTITISMVELLTDAKISKDIIADLRHCEVITAPLFDKYLRV